MRISGGDAKGTRLTVPKGSRPASEKVRQAVLSSLGSHVPSARVLDLFCGSGAYGLEALSRGADEVVFVDTDSLAISACRANATAAGLGQWIRTHKKSAERYLEREAAAEGPFDLVFVDPPYVRGGPDARLLGLLAESVAVDGRVIWETRSTPDPFEPPSGWVVEADRRYGDTRVVMLTRGAGVE